VLQSLQRVLISQLEDFSVGEAPECISGLLVHYFAKYVYTFLLYFLPRVSQHAGVAKCKLGPFLDHKCSFVNHLILGSTEKKRFLINVTLCEPHGLNFKAAKILLT
jgi:hypothetical protein